MAPTDYPKDLLDSVDIKAAISLVSYAADVVFVLDTSGKIHDVIHGEKIGIDDGSDLIGKKWMDTIAIDSHPKVHALLDSEITEGAQKWRQINQLLSDGKSLPILFSTLHLPKQQKILAIGRDLRSISTLQQRLVDAQQEIERDYTRLHAIENRYSQLFNITDQAYLLIDSQTLKILEANKASGNLLGDSKKLIGKLVVDLFSKADQESIHDYFAEFKIGNLQQNRTAHLQNSNDEVEISSALLREGRQSVYLISLNPLSINPTSINQGEHSSLLLKAIDESNDAFVITNLQGLIISSNKAFVQMTHSAQAEYVIGKSLEQWLGRSTIDLRIILNTLREHGSIKNYATTITSDDGGSPLEAEISGVDIRSHNPPAFAFSIRSISKRVTQAGPTPSNIEKNARHLTELVGKVPLKEIVTETTDIIEKLCIISALELTMSNRASAAELLGLSRQGLYIKMRRFGIIENSASEDNDS
ncbi:MAG: transcriptional regulator PpsR [Polynucleobacter sp.]|nr:transcriptional regulator PpsR [Polynucleobacter sp.]